MTGLLTFSLLFTALMTGCGEKEITLTQADYTITDETTASGITVGSTFEDFAAAYESYPLQIRSGDGSYAPYTLPDLKKDDTAGSGAMTLMAACFFEDGQAVTTSELLEETGVSSEELEDVLTSQDYLAEHSLIYMYMLFDFDGGRVIGLASDYLDYNNEL